MKRCEEITRLNEQSKEEKLSFWDNVSVKLHLMICKFCKKFAKDSKYMDGLISESLKNQKSHSLSDEEKAQLLKKLEG